MATLIAQRLRCITIAGGAGAALRLQLFKGADPNRFLIADLELTGAQNSALVTALQAAAATTTDTDIPAQESPLPGVYEVG